MFLDFHRMYRLLLREKEQELVLELERVVVQEVNKPSWDEEQKLRNPLRLIDINNLIQKPIRLVSDLLYLHTTTASAVASSHATTVSSTCDIIKHLNISRQFDIHNLNLPDN